MKIVTRKEAKKNGLKKYFSGLPCVHGHLAERYTGKGSCVDCMKIRTLSKERVAYDKQYYLENKERVSERNKEYYKANREQYLEGARNWTKKNPEKRRFISNNYKHRRRSIEKQGDSTTVIREWERKQEKVCYWCSIDCQDNYHLDHYYPLSKGGEHSTNNLVISCPPCNFRKSNKDPEKYKKEVSRITINPKMAA